MRLLLDKMIALLLLAVLSMSSGSIPYWMVNKYWQDVQFYRKSNRILKYLNLFNGGLYFGVVLLHLMPDGVNRINEYNTFVRSSGEYPLFHFIVGVGYFLFGLLEWVMAACNPDVAYTYRPSSQTASIEVNQRVSTSMVVTENKSSKVSGPENRSSGTIDRPIAISQSTQHIQVGLEPKFTITTIAKSSLTRTPKTFMRILAVAVHTVFDGVSVGQQESRSEIWIVLTTTAVHKSAMIFCLGWELFHSSLHTTTDSFLLLAFFSFTSSIGVFIGAAMTSDIIDPVSHALYSGVLQAVASGTFLHAVFVEILCDAVTQEERNKCSSILCLIAGFSVIALITLGRFTPGFDDHELPANMTH